MDSADLDALEGAARARMAASSFAFAAAGADDEITATENAARWRALRLRPRVLGETANIDATTTVLGRPALPIMVAPMGRHRLFHPEGEIATARGAAAAEAIFVLATNATATIEEVAAHRSDAPQWFQLYLSDRTVAEGLIDRAAAAGFGAIVLTADMPVYGSSPRAARSPLVASEQIRNVNLPGAPVARNAYDTTFSGSVTYPVTIEDVEWLVRRAPLPIVVKGVLRGDDAARCVEAGAKAVIVSNHGGRHLDTAIATADALPEIVAAVGGKAEVYVDGGIRRGTDILKALALGARAVLVGRPVVWGLAVNGADGVRDVLMHLRSELTRTMALCGVARIADATPDLVATVGRARA
jgi:isopentenyl diphosphate isomerase/L-lactate dehydrogenase-like FMN-dependent dehydrogenase